MLPHSTTLCCSAATTTAPSTTPPGRSASPPTANPSSSHHPNPDDHRRTGSATDTDANDADTADAVDDTDAADDPDEAAAAPDDAEIDAFSEGWFHDPAAWPQIALWAGVLTLISVLAYQLAKKTRHVSVGLVVGTVPFVVALYFFYQNVNRLLPPGL